MKLLRPRETLTENLALMGLAAAINVALALLSTFLPLSSFALLLFLPLVSALTAFYCKDKYIPFYIVSSAVVSLLATCYDLSITLFDVIPSLIVGSFFGYLLKKGVTGEYSILLVSLAKVGINYGMIYLLKLIYGVDIIDSFINLLGLKEITFINDIVPTFIFGYSLIQELITYLLIALTTINFVNYKKQSKNPYLMNAIISWIAIIIIALGYFLAFTSFRALGYLLAMIGIYLSIATVKTLFRKNRWWIYLILGILLLGTFRLSIVLFGIEDRNIAILGFLPFFVSISLCSSISSLLFMSGKGEKS